MTPEHIKLIKLSFAPLIGRKLEAGKLFYQRLFEIAPETRVMFKSDINEQAKKLMDTLGMAISSLQDGPTLLSMLRDMGKRHSAYGVKDEHYTQVGSALLWTLEQMLGDAFTGEVKKAWTDLYISVSDIMRAAARDHALPGAASAARVAGASR